MHALVTGGAGYLGHHLVHRLRDAGVEVTVLDRAPTSGDEHLAGVRYVQGDLLDPDVLGRAAAGATVIYHAAFAAPRASRADLTEGNVGGTAAVCRTAADGGARLVAISSTIVEQPPRSHPFWAGAPLSRLDEYQATRTEAERRVVEHAALGHSAAVVRPKTFVGPGRIGGFALVFELISEGRAVPVPGGGTNRYQLIDVRDLADGLFRLAAAGEGTFHFGATEVGTLAEDYGTLIDHAGTGARLRALPGRPAAAGMRLLELAGLPPASELHRLSAAGRDSLVDTTRAREELGWRPLRSNAEALCDAYDWFAARRRAGLEARTTHPVPRSHRLLKSVVGGQARSQPSPT